MSQDTGDIYNSQCLRIRDHISQCKLKIQLARENDEKFKSLDSKIKMAESVIDMVDLALEQIKPWIDSLQKYNAKKKTEALMSLNSALSVASCVVPASMKGIKFRIEGKEAWLENEKGMSVDRMEGSGYKGVVSAYLCMMVLKANPNILPFMLLDEPLSKLSAENSAVLSSYIPILTERLQVIWIEQKQDVFSNVENKTVYTFRKSDDGYSIVTREDFSG